MGSLGDLKVLMLARNRIFDFPEDICKIASLRILNIEKNKLTKLPKLMNQMHLIDLRVGHNYLEKINDDLFSDNLGKSIKYFSCVENNLLELPESLSFIHPQCSMEADYNPLVSPPAYLLSEGLVTLQHYFQIRQYRKKILFELMIDEDFELSMESFAPFATEVLEDGTGFLTPEDLASFDQAVDEYINGEFYKCPATGEEIVASVTKLREDREVELYLTILRTFLTVLNTITKNKDPRYPDSTVFSSTRPWGMGGESCNVWCISLQALLRDTPANAIYENGRPSIFQLVAEALPPIAFPFTVDLLKDSIRLYMSPYGQVGDTEQVTFPSCDCIDEGRNKPKKHNPCTKAAVVLCKSIYVEEEARRREEEEEDALERFEEVEDDIRIWILTEEGKLLLEKEVKKRKALLREEIGLREEMILSQQLKLKKASDNLKNLTVRKNLLEQGASYDNHGFHSIEEAIVALGKAEDEVTLFNDRIEILKEKNKDLKAILDQDWKASCKSAIGDLIQKYCFTSYQEIVKAYRRKAAEGNLNRHWDGDEGQSFDDWKRKFIAKQMSKQADEELLKELQIEEKKAAADGEEEEEGEEGEEGEKKKEKKDELEPEFDWTMTDDMNKFKLYLYNTYRKSRPLDMDFK